MQQQQPKVQCKRSILLQAAPVSTKLARRVSQVFQQASSSLGVKTHCSAGEQPLGMASGTLHPTLLLV